MPVNTVISFFPSEMRLASRRLLVCIVEEKNNAVNWAPSQPLNTMQIGIRLNLELTTADRKCLSSWKSKAIYYCVARIENIHHFHEKSRPSPDINTFYIPCTAYLKATIRQNRTTYTWTNWSNLNSRYYSHEIRDCFIYCTSDTGYYLASQC